MVVWKPTEWNQKGCQWEGHIRRKWEGREKSGDLEDSSLNNWAEGSMAS